MTFWFFTLFFLLLALQAAPGTDRLLEGAGAPLMAGWLFHFALVALTVEALLGRFSRVVIALPLLFYVSYYAAYWLQGRQIVLESRRLAAQNPKKLIDFDPAKQALVMEGADLFVGTHAVPIAFRHDPSQQPEEYVSYRLLPIAQLWPFIGAAPRSVQVLGVFWGDVKQPNVREVSMPMKPKGHLVTATVVEPGPRSWQSWNIGRQTTEIALDGAVLGAFKTADVDQLPAFPLFAIGCWREPDAPRRCDANFVLRRRTIASWPQGVDEARYDTPVSVMLGIAKYTDAEFSGFQGYASNEAAADEPSADTDAAFAALQGVIEGRNPAVDWTTAHEIASDPKRLAPLAASLAVKYLDFAQGKTSDVPGRRDQAALLASALVALPPAEFAKVADSLSAAMRAEGAWQDYPALYVRLAGAAPTMFSFYRDRFLYHHASRTEELLAALAICRIGQADGELMAAMKTRWADTGAQEDTYKSALFVTLAKLKQQDFLRKADRSPSKLLQSWYDAVLAGRGSTSAGPNNCMPMEWPLPQPLPPSFAPRLRWSHQQWTAEASK